MRRTSTLTRDRSYAAYWDSRAEKIVPMREDQRMSSVDVALIIFNAVAWPAAVGLLVAVEMGWI
jgi:hypothetical protein